MEFGEITPSSSSSLLSTSQSTPLSSYSFEGFGGDHLTCGNFTASSILFEIEKDELLGELQQLINRYNNCFCILKDSITDVKILRQENLELVAQNLELELLIEEKASAAAVEAAAAMNGVSPPTMQSGKGKEMIGSDHDSPGGSGSSSGSATGTGSGPGSITESGSGSGSEGAKKGKGGMPKCISIRSTHFLAGKNMHAGGAHRLRLPTPAALHGGDEKKEEEVELEVYNQGTAKTELCNKWGNMKWCPYGSRCQFAHGIEELKPVIRHPRYKTQQCRMMGTGGDCPYGHRCHFRHANPNTPAQ